MKKGKQRKFWVGDSLLGPQSPILPPQHPNCRSAVVPSAFSLVAFNMFHQAFVEAVLDSRQSAPSNSPGSWEALGLILGPEVVQRVKGEQL